MAKKIDKDDLALYGALYSSLNRSKAVCDPLQFLKRRDELLMLMAEVLLIPYRKYLDEQEKAGK